MISVLKNVWIMISKNVDLVRDKTHRDKGSWEVQKGEEGYDPHSEGIPLHAGRQFFHFLRRLAL